MDVAETRLQVPPSPYPAPAPVTPAGETQPHAPPEAGADQQDDRSRTTAIWDAPWVPRSTLKMALSAADVDARFEIDDTTSRVTVTMYDRRSGEVLRQIPPAELQAVIDAVAGRGIIVDVTS